MFVSPEEIIAKNFKHFQPQFLCEKQLKYTTETPTQSIQHIINHYGERVFLDALNTIMKERGLAVATGRAHRADTGDPELDRLINILYALWETGDEKLKTWAAVQFDFAITKHIDEEILKKQKESHEQTSVG